MNMFLLSKDWILTKSHSKLHYQIAYKIGMNRNEYILLDVLYEDTHYKKVNCLSLENPFVKWDGEPVKVNVPSADDILGYKITAVAPNTSGFRTSRMATDDMKAIAVKVGKTLRTVRRQIKRAIESGEVQMIRAGEYRKL